MPTPLESKFARLKESGEAALIVYVTAGDPGLDQLVPILECLSEAGADVIEIGIPFSDPIADGPVIQASSQRSLDRGTTPAMILEELAKFKSPVPLVAMGYYNTFLRPGLDAFTNQLQAAGVSGVIVCDTIPEEASDWVNVCRSKQIDTIFLAAPTSTDQRLNAVADLATGFVYAVARTGVTGARTEVEGGPMELISKLKSRTEKPVCLGFGISHPDQVASAATVADGVVVGSSLVTKLATEWNGGAGRQAIFDYVKGLKAATKRQ